MPPKFEGQRTRERNLEKARESKRVCLSDEATFVTAAQEPSVEPKTASERGTQELVDVLNLSVDALH